MNNRLIIVLILFILFSCKKKEAIPNSLKIAFDYLDENWNKEEKISFKEIEDKASTPVFYGFTIEDELQNKLLKNHKASHKIQTFFDSLGIDRTADKAGLILNTYHNYINDKDIELKKEVSSILNYWEPIEKCEQLLKEKAIRTYNDFNINKTLIVQMPVDEHNNATDYNCPKVDWIYREGKDLTIGAILIEKSISKDSSNISFQLKLISKSKEHTEILFEEVYKGDIFNINLYNSWKFSHPKHTNESKKVNI